MPKSSEKPQALQVSGFKEYLTNPLLLWYYQEINKPGSSVSDVDTFYLNFLKDVFTLRDLFGVEQEARTASQLGIHKKSDDFTTCSVRDSNGKRVILCENRQRDEESQTSIWSDALEYAVSYTLVIRLEDSQDSEETLYLTVNIGTHLRFHELPGKSSEARDWAPAAGRC
ncbi:hypothetical protein VHEMI04000 [[Torrubiella] hemipterigena]|uniref:Fungal-type protein kinase domain-containing protein n=1 Tax=[Torrubiella] hemipterigena TaxID=1531966 RepID=A0A0A1TF41_9HYPO|nr:hypothetical protein VHEMI04000 [[Torrubiella] hemipterigena]